jgi:hypothetical protein
MQHFDLKHTLLLFIFRFELLFFYFGPSVKASNEGAIIIITRATPLTAIESQ